MFHKTLYRETNHKACMITQSPLASAESLAVLAERFGMEALVRPGRSRSTTPTGSITPVVKPIDAEAVYLNPRVGLCRGSACCGDPRHAALAQGRLLHCWRRGDRRRQGHARAGGPPRLVGESIARFRQAVHLTHMLRGGPPLDHYEPKTQ